MIRFRTQLRADDPDKIATVVADTGFFSRDEVDIAHELAVDTLSKGETSGYHFLLVDPNDGPSSRTLLPAYACYGPIPGTRASYDLYWIVVSRANQRAGLGQALMAKVEQLVRSDGGTRLYADTSSRPQYAPTRAFYERCGFTREALLEDFYDQGDGKAIYVKRLR